MFSLADVQAALPARRGGWGMGEGSLECSHWRAFRCVRIWMSCGQSSANVATHSESRDPDGARSRDGEQEVERRETEREESVCRAR